MTVKNPKCLVVDASILRASQGENALYPIPTMCRNFLYEMLTLGYYALVTNDILEEWEKHHSRYSRKWYASMMRKGKIIRFRGTPQNDKLRKQILDAVEENTHQAILKDLHLIEAVLLDDADDIIASLDDKMRQHFQRASQDAEILQIIIWVNPTVEEEVCVIWLRQSAPNDEHRTLGYRSNQ